jgi:hypothetical protein
MKAIIHNPYRVLGLLVGATAKEQVRQIKRLKQYLEAEQVPENDFSFPILSKFERKIESVENAESKLNLNLDKVEASLFWFYKGYEPIDQAAFDALNDGLIDDSIEVWEKFIQNSGSVVTNRTYSSFQNISTLYLLKATWNNIVNHDLLVKAIQYKFRFFESDYFDQYIKNASDETFKANINELEYYFLNNVRDSVINHISLRVFIDLLNRVEFDYKEKYIKSLLDSPIDEIDKKIEEVKSKRKKNPELAIELGNNLYTTVSKDLGFLKEVLSPNNLKYANLADRVADELLQCAIDYFLFYRDKDIDPSKEALELCAYSKNLACGKISTERVRENSENIQEWAENKPYRESKKLVQEDYDQITAIIDRFMNEKDTIANAKIYFNTSIPLLNNIKTKLGEASDLYLTLSTRVCSDVQSMCITEINDLQDRVTSGQDVSRRVALVLLKTAVDDAWVLSRKIGVLDLKDDFRTRYNKNHESLRGLKNTIDNINKPSGGSSGCYIATMVYGDYDHPQVMVLREFRDKVLSKNTFGRLFIKIYYRISPSLVQLLRNNSKANQCIKIILERIIKIINNEN